VWITRGAVCGFTKGQVWMTVCGFTREAVCGFTEGWHVDGGGGYNVCTVFTGDSVWIHKGEVCGFTRGEFS
jgi:hypothetical protein